MDALTIIDCASYVASLGLTAACGLTCFCRAQKREEEPLFDLLLAGFYACIFMSNAFFLFTWLVEDYPFVFSPGDISWVGGILFLITAALSLTDAWTPEQRQAARRNRPAALIAPAVCVAFNIAYIGIYPEITLNYLLYGIPTAILAYLSLWLSLATEKGGARFTARLYHPAVLAWIAVQLCYDLFYSLGWEYGYAVPAVVSGWLMTLLTAGLCFAARKGVAK